MARLYIYKFNLGSFSTNSALKLELLAEHLIFEISHSGFDKGEAIERLMVKPPFMTRCPGIVIDAEPGYESVLAVGGLAFSCGGKLPGLSDWFAGPEELRAWVRAHCR